MVKSILAVARMCGFQSLYKRAFGYPRISEESFEKLSADLIVLLLSKKDLKPMPRFLRPHGSEKKFAFYDDDSILIMGPRLAKSAKKFCDFARKALKTEAPNET